MTTIEYAVSLINSHWINCDFKNAKLHAEITVKNMKSECNSVFDSWWQDVNKNIKELTIEEFSKIKNK